MSQVLAHLPARPGRPEHQVILVRTQAEREALYRLRHQVYVTELGIVAADHPFVQDEALVDPFDEHSHNMLLRIGGEVAGSLRLSCATDGPLEIDHYTRASEACPDPSRAAEVTRLMVARQHRGSQACHLLLYAQWRLIQQLDLRYLLVAGKLGSLGRYYKNLCAAGLTVMPGDFTYGLTGCRYELIQADMGTAGSLRRMAWRAHIAVLALLAFGVQPLGHRVIRRGTRGAALSPSLARTR